MKPVLIRSLSAVMLSYVLAACAASPQKGVTRADAPKAALPDEDDTTCQRKAIEKQLARTPLTHEWQVMLLKDHTIKLLIPSDPVFDRGTAQFKPEMLWPLQILAQAIGTCDRHVIHVLSYTDHSGTTEQNQSLTERRAVAVADALSAHGVAATSLRQEGRGGSHPLASNETRQGQRRNRRIEIYIKRISNEATGAAWVPPP